ncbi:hypothetical protein HBH53_264590 [Parastagonospora nodorum]|nr:hypothetical protein HBH53_264590 [Parastagonospora nodorum]KAH4215246.1 hypothetical protein HBI06_258500 [Parastagonospora nodorum]KAH4220549.1 hypothetical protein HBI05_256720 [Parastagonospora nodorum]KAH5045930.1 hypothetical protein HBI73_251390 [Parastagonospora nodorum]KAH5390882.1 hypothetical protein HBI47_254210 [Parastagonospora nodorum]
MIIPLLVMLFATLLTVLTHWRHRYRTWQAPPLLRNRRVFGIDRAGELLRAVRESRLLETLSCYVRQAGNTLEYALLGRTGIVTTEPVNIATLLAMDKGSRRTCHEVIIMFRC